MKATGIVRKIDSLGRIVIPASLRRVLNVEINDCLEIYTDNENIILKKYHPVCVICGNEKSLVDFKGKKICRDCIRNFD